MSRAYLKYVAPIVVVALGLVAAWLLASSRRAPGRVERPSVGPLVEVIRAEVTSVPVVVAGHGEVVPRVAVDVADSAASRRQGASSVDSASMPTSTPSSLRVVTRRTSPRGIQHVPT